MLAMPPLRLAHPRRRLPSLPAPRLPLFALQPLLGRIVRQVARQNPGLFGRLGPHARARFLIDAHGLPFLLLLRPDPTSPQLRAIARGQTPLHDARIAGKLADLLPLIDGSADGDALFFSRELDIGGNVEAVVCLRNALDDVEGSIAAQMADLFGPPGRIALTALRRISGRTSD